MLVQRLLYAYDTVWDVCKVSYPFSSLAETAWIFAFLVNYITTMWFNCHCSKAQSEYIKTAAKQQKQ